MDFRTPLHWGIALYTTGVCASFSLRPLRRGFSYLFPALGSIGFLLYGIYLAANPSEKIGVWEITPFSRLSFAGDGVSGFFLILISVLSIAASVYAVDYTKGAKRPVLMGVLYNLFILSMYAVVLASDAVTFLIFWEAMTIASYFLVTIERDPESARAGFIYAVMAHAGTAFIMAALLVLYKEAGSMDFGMMRLAASGMKPGLRNLVFIFASIGFCTKAGLIPFHSWLPRAHPAAPSHVSALMSGAMIKMGLYGFLRIIPDTLGAGPQWWGLSVLVMGALSAVLGILYALMENDIKRLLAFSSVDNMGIIFLGIGASMAFASDGLVSLSVLALSAALFHSLNHSVFKGLLFMGAGSVMHGTGTKNIEEMGGLLKKMPYTGLFFLAGSLSICALPPFNGFASEWMTFQSLLLGYNAESVTAKILTPLGGAALALAGALAGAAFIKAFGISFLGAPRNEKASNAHESPFLMTASMAVLGILCLVMGIYPGLPARAFSGAVIDIAGVIPPDANQLIVGISETSSSISPAGMLIIMSGLCLSAGLFALAYGGRRKTVKADSWDCGIPGLNPRMEYSATGFIKPLRMIFKRIYLPKAEVRVSYILKPLFAKEVRYKEEITPFLERHVFAPAVELFLNAVRRAKALQSGSLHLYLAYMLITLIVLLVFGI